jgi:GAF domain-containing protein
MASKAHQGELVHTFVTLADTLVVGYDVVDLLHTLVERCATILDASAAGILLLDAAGDLEVVASTSERSRLVELMQLRAGEGPCMESVASGHAVSVGDIDSVSEKWPQFRLDTLAQGFAAVHAVPLRLREEVIGSLNLFWDAPGVLDETDAMVAQALADVATIGILHERSIRESDISRAQLQHALDSRVVIEQAKGVVAQTHDTDMDSAFAILRKYARDNQLRLAGVAAQVVDRSLQL